MKRRYEQVELSGSGVKAVADLTEVKVRDKAKQQQVVLSDY